MARPFPRGAEIPYHTFGFSTGFGTADRKDDRRMIERETMADRDKRTDDGKDDVGNASGVAVQTRTKTKRPSMYKVLMLNDDYTPMEFVVHVLERFFSKSREEATQVMLHVHRRGVGVCGVYTYEVAETKVNQVTEFARRNQHPLRCTLEKE
jgi:ATP-dependent Clp protease adaptor protein ClpS